jgi:hypothetical protein
MEIWGKKHEVFSDKKKNHRLIKSVHFSCARQWNIFMGMRTKNVQSLLKGKWICFLLLFFSFGVEEINKNLHSWLVYIYDQMYICMGYTANAE